MFPIVELIADDEVRTAGDPAEQNVIERLSIDYESGRFDGPFSRVDAGFELAHVEAGAGMRVNTGLVIGPFASYAAGLFRTSKASGSCNGGGDVLDKTVHGTLMLGLRAMYTVP